ncbi:FecCD family ABC transporter permease [Vibrio lentus]|uniref:FecCD family ABC transporter permease n=1 Tax=Vibrio lentus TaxID=136468 RepID=UPI001CF03291|nr:iron ABC transporter permease [Vibrio lentus]MDN3632965.1 iron ABC transporter permease [Vibrio lentus]
MSHPTSTLPKGMLHPLRMFQRRQFLIVMACFALIIFSGLASLMTGEVYFSASQVATALLQPSDSLATFLVIELRLPRFLIALFVGATLGMAGNIVQSITRNPLGSPDLMGVSAGASFAIVVCMAWSTFPPLALLSVGTIGGFSAGFVTFLIAWKTRLNPLHLTLSGMCISLFFNAAIVVVLITAKADANGIYFWLTGSLMDRTWQHAVLLIPFAFLGLLLGVVFSKPLNLLMLEDITCESLGFPVHVWRVTLGFIAVVLTAATVSIAGPISFVGLIAPHITRLTLYNKRHIQCTDHRQSLPISALVGATLVCVADTLAKLHNVPVGILCVLVGGPLFVYLIKKKVE